jgi:hypothetical protein
LSYKVRDKVEKLEVLCIAKLFRSSLEVTEEGLDLTIAALELTDEGDYRYSTGN